MSSVSIATLDTPVRADDWYLVFMTVSILLSILVMGPYRKFYFKGISNMFRFNSPGADICFPLYTPLGYVLVSMLSCTNFGLALLLLSSSPECSGISMIYMVLTASGLSGLFFLFKLLLYQIVNSSLYKSQATMVKTSRWNGFFIMAFSATGFAVVLLTAVVLFLELPSYILAVCSVIVVMMTETGLIFKIKTSLLRNNCSTYSFILYLCALELGPIALMLVLLVINL